MRNLWPPLKTNSSGSVCSIRRLDQCRERLGGLLNSSINQYLWDLGNGDVRPLKISVIHYVYEKPGAFAVTLRVRDALGFSATAKALVSVEPLRAFGLR